MCSPILVFCFENYKNVGCKTLAGSIRKSPLHARVGDLGYDSNDLEEMTAYFFSSCRAAWDKSDQSCLRNPPVRPICRHNLFKKQEGLTYFEPPQPSNIFCPLKASGLQSLIHTALQRDQATDPSSDHRHLLCHGLLSRNRSINTASLGQEARKPSRCGQ